VVARVSLLLVLHRGSVFNLDGATAGLVRCDTISCLIQNMRATILKKHQEMKSDISGDKVDISRYDLVDNSGVEVNNSGMKHKANTHKKKAV
jgi:hypothetical protein